MRKMIFSVFIFGSMLCYASPTVIFEMTGGSVKFKGKNYEYKEVPTIISNVVAKNSYAIHEPIMIMVVGQDVAVDKIFFIMKNAKDQGYGDFEIIYKCNGDLPVYAMHALWGKPISTGKGQNSITRFTTFVLVEVLISLAVLLLFGAAIARKIVSCVSKNGRT